MTIHLTPDLEAALQDVSRKRGLPAEAIALESLRKQFLQPAPLESRDEWERTLRSIAVDAGVSFSDAAVSSEGIYE